ncbi:hypothetical protein FACS1894158_04840 [Betaproteobacteria bacterium]|nr:hypothetical protein FACS1894158_04840 [Betaproteobacteria bacterium]
MKLCKQFFALIVCLPLVAALCLFTPLAQAATNLSVTGGQGGNGNDTDFGGSGGGGGYVLDNAQGFWAAGGGGGGASGDGTALHDGGDGNSGNGGGFGPGGYSGSSGGTGGAGTNQTGGTAPGQPGSGTTGGSGGGFTGQSYAGGAYTVEGGGGGTGPNGTGGKGGDAALSITGGTYDFVMIVAGSGNSGGAAGIVGGDGGSAGLTVTGSLNAGTVLVQSGGSGTSGAGGAAGFTANTLISPNITLMKRDGALTFNVTTLDVSGNTSLDLNATTAAGVNIGTVALSGDNINIYSSNGGAATISNLELTGSGRNFTLDAGAAGNVSVGQLTINGGTIDGYNYTNLINGTFYTTSAITLGSSGATFDIYGNQTLSRVLTGTGSLTKTGSGTLTLSGANNYSGGTTISEGTLALSGSGSIAASSGVTLDNVSGAIFDISNASGDTTIKGLNGGGTNGGDVWLDTKNLTINNSEANSYGGVIGGTGGLTKTDAGTLTLSGTNTYTGGTTVSGGILEGNTTSLQGAIANNANVTFNQTSAGTYSGIMSGSGSLTKTGSGDLTLNAANIFSGSLAIDTGALLLGSSGSLAATSMSMGGGTTFDFSAAGAYSGSSPNALKNLTVNGEGATIKASAGGADFSGGSLGFNVPSTAGGNTAMLNVDGTAIIDPNTSFLISDARPSVAVGQGLTLLSATTLNANGVTSLSVQALSGDIYTIEVNGNQLSAVLGSLVPTGPAYERLKAYAESRAASLAFANQGLDFILNRGFGSALAATIGQGFRSGSFGGIGGGWSRYDTGSHADVSGASLLAGIALGSDISHGRLTLGAFFEGGQGNYTSYNSFSNAARVKGKGDTSYYGGGFLGRYDLNSGPLSGLYFDASARVGRTDTDFRTGDIQYNGWKARFDSDALYYGLHGGIGYVWPIPGLDGKGSLDLSAKVLWTRQQGDSVTVHQDRVRFKDADSLRVRLGGRFTYAVNEYVSPYIGAYWEHESDGKQKTTVNGVDIGAPSLKGDTGIGEIGLTWKPSPTRPLSLDFGVRGYAGRPRSQI